MGKLVEVEAPAFFLVKDYWVVPDSSPPVLKTLYAREWVSDPFVYGILYLFFHLLWFKEFCIYFNYLTMAGIVARWYFTACDQESGKKIDLESWTVYKSMKRTCRFHLGSVALGALIIATVQAIRAWFAYMKAQYLETTDNSAAQAVGCCISCLLWCLECCLDKLSQNAYVWQSVYGSSFCHGACSATALLL